MRRNYLIYKLKVKKPHERIRAVAEERISRLERFLLPSFYSLTTEYVEESNFSNKEIIFDEINNKIIINGMTGFIKLQKGNGYFSNLRVAIWKPADDLINEIEDEQMDDKEIVDYFEISVTDRGVIFNGKLVSEELKKQFVVTEINNELYVKYTDVKIEIPIPADLSIDDLAVRFEGDGAPNTKDNLTNMTNSTKNSLLANDFNLVIYPNPMNSVLNIEFANNLSNANTIIEIYNSNGEKVNEVFSGNLLKEENTIKQVNLSQFINGVYFILIESNGNKLVKQFVKQ